MMRVHLMYIDLIASLSNINLGFVQQVNESN